MFWGILNYALYPQFQNFPHVHAREAPEIYPAGIRFHALYPSPHTHEAVWKFTQFRIVWQFPRIVPKIRHNSDNSDNGYAFFMHNYFLIPPPTSCIHNHIIVWLYYFLYPLFTPLLYYFLPPFSICNILQMHLQFYNISIFYHFPKNHFNTLKH